MGQESEATVLPSGILVVLEGIDGAGKTTQVDLLASAARRSGLDVVVSKEPTDGKWGRQLRASATSGRLSLDEELELFLKDRAEHVETVVNPSLKRGALVILDRYYFSTAAYQGARGARVERILEENERFAPLPDLLVFLDTEPEVGRARISARGDRANLFESLDGLRAAAEIFRALSYDSLLCIDGHLPIPTVQAQITTAVNRLIFKQLCGKSYKTACEPVNCSVRLSGSCRYTAVELPTSAELD